MKKIGVDTEEEALYYASHRQKLRRNVMRVKLVDNLYEVMVRYWNDENETNSPEHKEFCDKYSGKEVSLYCIGSDWFINRWGDDDYVIPECAFTFLEPFEQMNWLQNLETKAAILDWLIEQGDDFQWENIIRVDIDGYPSRMSCLYSLYRNSLDNTSNTK